MKALQELHCAECRESIVATSPSTRFQEAFTLLNAKNLGGLQVPADGVITILMSAERHLRQMSEVDILQRNCSLLRLQVKVLDDVGLNALDIDQHTLDTALGLENHYSDLVRMLLRIYFNVRMHHIARLHTLRLQGRRMRNKYTKLILFKGQ